MSYFKVGDKVDKRKGYSFPGIIVSVFNNLAGEERIVVQADTKQGKPFFGILHIFDASALIKR